MRMRCAASLVADAEMPQTVVQKAPARLGSGDYFRCRYHDLCIIPHFFIRGPWSL